MPIVRIDPEQWHAANIVQVDSDAPDNAAAIDEVERWAVDNGFRRTNEYWLRRLRRPGGADLYRAVCYRMTREEAESADEAMRRIAETASRIPPTRKAE